MAVLDVGATLTNTRTITAEMIESCARLTGDYGAHHVAGLAGRQVAQGLLAVASTPLLDVPQIHLTQMSLQFIAPVFVNETVRAAAEVVGVDAAADGSRTVRFTLSVANDAGVEVLRGKGIGVVPPDVTVGET